jgi:hypothetical protein
MKDLYSGKISEGEEAEIRRQTADRKAIRLPPRR